MNKNEADYALPPPILCTVIGVYSTLHAIDGSAWQPSSVTLDAKVYTGLPSMRRFGSLSGSSNVNNKNNVTIPSGVPPSLTSNGSFEHTPLAALGTVHNSNTLEQYETV